MLSMSDIKNIPNLFDVLSVREKLIIFLAIFSFVILILYVFLLNPIEESVDGLKKKESNLISLLSSKQAVSNTHSLSGGYEVAFSNKIKQLNQSIASVDYQISNSKKKTIDIDDLGFLLKDILSSNHKLSLESLKVYPAERLIRNDVAESHPMGGGVVKNTVYFKFTGDYVSVVDYLKSVEQLEWLFFWRDIEYKVDQYPKATVEINLYTLSIG